MRIRKGWYWDRDELGAGPYKTLDDVVTDLGLEADRTAMTETEFLTLMVRCGTRIEYRYGTPRGML